MIVYHRVCVNRLLNYNFNNISCCKIFSKMGNKSPPKSIQFSTLSVPWEPEPRDAFWMSMHKHFLAQTKAHASEMKVVFLGASIIARWTETGKKLWDEHYAPRGAFNYGIDGDSTENVLWRIQNGEFDGVQPKLVVLNIGTNNLWCNKVADICKGIQAILTALHTKMPNAKVLLLSIFPQVVFYEKPDTKIHDLNASIQQLADHNRVHYLDLAVHFEISLGQGNAKFYADPIHLNAKGYELWYRVMEPIFKQLIA